MATFFNGHNLENVDKLNIEGNLAADCKTDNEVLQQFNPSEYGNLLRTVRFNAPNFSKFWGNGAGILFGQKGMASILGVAPFDHLASITVSTDSGTSIGWSENIAWKSDIEALNARISALEKQIGGVLSSTLNHLKSRIEVVA